jgi:hypothetical protein
MIPVGLEPAVLPPPGEAVFRGAPEVPVHA